jgi:hypothetical protein
MHLSLVTLSVLFVYCVLELRSKKIVGIIWQVLAHRLVALGKGKVSIVFLLHHFFYLNYL